MPKRKFPISCIYTITNIINNKIYVGFAIEFQERILRHVSFLRNNKHHNLHLQNAWNKYGEKSFKFEILEECDRDLLASQENYWCNMLNTHNRRYGYNIRPTNPHNNVVFSEETLMKLKNKIPNRKGIKLSKETKDKISVSKQNISSETKSLISETLKSSYKNGKFLNSKVNTNVICLITGKKFYSIKQACKVLRISYLGELKRLKLGKSKKLKYG